MKFNTIHSFSVLGLAGRALAACTGNLLVDNFSNYAANLNTLGSWTSDDGTMTSISGSTGKLVFTPKTSSYFYTTFSCIAASTEGYNALQFSYKAPASGRTTTVELQTSSGGCGASAYQSFYYTLSGLTGSTQTVTIPLSSFSGANLAAVKSIVWSGFSGAAGSWEMDDVRFVCAGAASSSTTVAGTSSTTTRTSSTTVAGTSSTTTRISSSSTAVVVTSTTKTTTTTTVPPTSTPTGTCTAPLVIDDWVSQSRLTFLFYNAMMLPTSDDGSMTSVVVDSNTNRVTFTPKSGSYFYSNTGCLAASKYGGISLRIKAAAGTTLTVQLQSSSGCSSDSFQSYDRTSTQLGWTFDGTEKLYNIPLSSFSGLDKDKVMAILFHSVSRAVTFGPMAFYCGTTVSEYVPPPRATDDGPTATVPITSATPSAFVIDQFANPDSNALGFWHGADDGMSATYSGGKLTLVSTDSDYSFYTQISGTCRDMRSYENAYLHIAYTGSNKFTIAMQQHNSACNPDIAPYPETWDVVDASRYAVSTTDIYVPLAHFNINKQRAIGFALKAFQTTNPTVLSKIEIVKTAPSTVTIPSKLATAPLYFACTRPNSFAFAIDDGIPELAQQVMQIIREENIKVTFFTVGAPLLDPSTNLSNVYNEMLSHGHQVALHSFTHPKFESLPNLVDVDWELQEDIDAVQETLGITSKYFRPPFGNEGARLRQRLAKLIPGSKVINWSVDVEDWLWATTSTPEKQLDAFKRDIAKGGNLVVLHYLYPSTVSYLRQFIQLAKATGKQLMRVDQCMEDPNAPAL